MIIVDFILQAIEKAPGRELITQWLKAGYVDREIFYATAHGVWAVRFGMIENRTEFEGDTKGATELNALYFPRYLISVLYH